MAQGVDQRSDAWQRIVQRAWGDEGFKQRLIADPRGVLAEYDIDAGGRRIVVVEDSGDQRHLVLPAKAGDVSVSEEGTEPLSDANPGF